MDENYRKHIIKIARQLNYENTVIRKLSEAKTEIECDRIMKTARNQVKNNLS